MCTELPVIPHCREKHWSWILGTKILTREKSEYHSYGCTLKISSCWLQGWWTFYTVVSCYHMWLPCDNGYVVVSWGRYQCSWEESSKWKAASVAGFLVQTKTSRTLSPVIWRGKLFTCNTIVCHLWCMSQHGSVYSIYVKYWILNSMRVFQWKNVSIRAKGALCIRLSKSVIVMFSQYVEIIRFLFTGQHPNLITLHYGCEDFHWLGYNK